MNISRVWNNLGRIWHPIKHACYWWLMWSSTACCVLRFHKSCCTSHPLLYFSSWNCARFLSFKNVLWVVHFLSVPKWMTLDIFTTRPLRHTRTQAHSESDPTLSVGFGCVCVGLPLRIKWRVRFLMYQWSYQTGAEVDPTAPKPGTSSPPSNNKAVFYQPPSSRMSMSLSCGGIPQDLTPDQARAVPRADRAGPLRV